mgnify:CR=1 FL=1
MLLTVLVMSGFFLGATAIAGLLMSYQLRQVTNIVDASKAIFAADAATERALFLVFRCNDVGEVPAAWPDNPLPEAFCNALGLQSSDDPALPPFMNEASYQLIIETACGSGMHVPDADGVSADCLKAGGTAGRSRRSFGIFF